ncbi:intradiol ring-cleavage dioxygenase [Pirellula staleyi DSM 6068]|uniref:Intradiol ring-cleavage dioxygenase n=1 Tax=Pirellula staleyi (strain ATCC 27377 / DSM 6068 / ICPB 4128) TaxID=530564 RepID=D2QWG7_PIRSD|nr:protocatechuate 3,4-dioxygenase [Pirellula staleyi]ADB17770.1 intradiol ring-cleavage dioxygenase [Pirellula staleyi DSM 6068]
MNAPYIIRSRRTFMAASAAAFASALWTTKGLFAEELMKTPLQTEGPFYPDKLPLDTDNDLLVINDGITPAVGTITHLTGKLTDTSGNPIRGAMIEIWQCDNNGAYLHSGTGNREKRDGNFQGFGRFFTGATGEYYFRTIKPVAYPGRTPHIHVAVKRPGAEMFTTQCYIKGEAQNERDGVLRGVRDLKARELLLASFEPIKESKIGELAASFNIVVGATPTQG